MKLKECTQDLHITDPRLDKARIEETKGGLLEGLCHWVFQKPDFLYWRDNPQSRVLWIKGDPGKGKTMLLCSIINELNKSTATTAHICYFFCQSMDSRINSATAVLRGLLFMLVSQEPSLISHMREKYDKTGKALFEDTNAWPALREIFTDILNDPSLGSTYIFIDALDECVDGLDQLLAFIVEKSSPSSPVKWILTSRNYTNIEQKLRLDKSGARFSLELKENATQISCAVNAYIKHCLTELKQIQHIQSLQLSVQEKMQEKANDTFLWVSLVMKELRDVSAWEVMQVLEEIPSDLIHVYRRMMEHINQLKRRNPEWCRRCLSTVIATYRPLHLQELHVLVDLPSQHSNIEETTAMFVKMCGSFLTLRGKYVYVIHQSAKDFLTEDTGLRPYLSGAEVVHKHIFNRSAQAMSTILQRDMYRLEAIGSLIEHVQTPEPDPLVALRYSCIHWIDHLIEWSSDSSLNDSGVLQSGGVVDSFFREKYIYWLEALSLCKSVSTGVRSMRRLQALINETTAAALIKIVQDACRFIMSHKSAIESSPLQVYASALLFSPNQSFTRLLFQKEEPKHVLIKPRTDGEWSRCLLTLEGGEYGHSVTFSHDLTQLALATRDRTIKFRDTSSGEYTSILKGHINTVAFSRDLTRLATRAQDGIFKVWDAYSAQILLTCQGHSRSVCSVAFSHDSAWLASGSRDRTIKVWDAFSSQCLRTLKGHGSAVTSLAFSYDSSRLASGSAHGSIRVWDMLSGKCILRLEGHHRTVTSVAFFHKCTWLASGSVDCTIRIWDLRSGNCLSTITDDHSGICSVAFSHNSTQLASATEDLTVKLWDVQSDLDKSNSNLNEENGNLDEGHKAYVESVAFSEDSTRLASASRDNTVKIWDTHSCKCLITLRGHRGSVWFVKFLSPTRLASSSLDKSVRIWETTSGECIMTLNGHTSGVCSFDFSYDLSQPARLASASIDGKIKVWDPHSSECLLTLGEDRYAYYFTSVIFSPDSKQIASSSSDCTVHIWDATSGKHEMMLRGHSRRAYLMAFSYDSIWLASASYDSTVKLWDINSGECLSTIKVEQPLHSMSFDSSDNYLHTDIGVIDLSTLSTLGSTETSIENHLIRSQGVNLSEDEAWITYKSEKLLLLPPDYRPSCSAVSGSIIAMGGRDGRVWICRVQHDTS